MERRERDREEGYESGSIKNYSGGIFRQHLLAVTHIFCPTDSSSTRPSHPPLTSICSDRVAHISGPSHGVALGIVQSPISRRKSKERERRRDSERKKYVERKDVEETISDITRLGLLDA